MTSKSSGMIHDQPAITTTGNQEERDAQVERVQGRHERQHRLAPTVVHITGLAEVRDDAGLSSRKEPD